MKVVIAAAVAALAASTFAQAGRRPMSEKFLQHTGGFILKPGTQQGEIAYVNCQSAAKKEWIAESMEYFKETSLLNLVLREGTFDLKKPVVVGNLSIFVVDDASLPISLIAPEARWAVMNVAPLKSEKEPFFRARVIKELSRVFAMLCGGYKSNYPGSLTDPIVKVEDLDKHMNNVLPVDVLNRFVTYLPPYGVTPAMRSTYLAACKEGWAPAPTNAYQKAVWDKVHEMPTEPIKVKPEVKKVEK